MDITPKDLVTFGINKNGKANQSLRTITLTNNSQGGLLFKVKTTTPERYLVRPNQGVIHAGEKIEVIVSIQTKELIALKAMEVSEWMLTTDKFLVQSAPASVHVQETLEKMESPEDLTKELSRLWAGMEKSKVTGKKLNCSFEEEASEEVKPPSVASTGSSLTMESLTNLNEATPECTNKEVYAELAESRKKFNDLVQFTVQLTTQRDDLMQQVEASTKKAAEEARKELEVTKSAGKSSGLRQRHGGPDSNKNIPTSSAPAEKQQFSIVHFLCAIAIAFLLGKYGGQG